MHCAHTRVFSSCPCNPILAVTPHHPQERKAAWGTIDFKQYIGMDVTSLLSVPVWIMVSATTHMMVACRRASTAGRAWS